jgi:DNA-binding NtrC family response regulator
MRILVVDDERSLLMTLAANLELDGFDVTMAENGQRAVELFENQPFDLVLSDIRMPGMSGVDLFRRIRAEWPEVPVVLMTGFALEGLVKEAVAEGVFTVLPKPFDIEHVVAALTSALRSPVVLVIDGDAGAAEATAEALRASGVRAASAADDGQVLATVRDGKVDVCVVHSAPGGGLAPDLVERVRQVDPSIVHIAIAGHDVEALLRKKVSGMFACLRAPVKTRELVETIARARGRRVRRDGA